MHLAVVAAACLALAPPASGRPVDAQEHLPHQGAGREHDPGPGRDRRPQRHRRQFQLPADDPQRGQDHVDHGQLARGKRPGGVEGHEERGPGARHGHDSGGRRPPGRQDRLRRQFDRLGQEPGGRPAVPHAADRPRSQASPRLRLRRRADHDGKRRPCPTPGGSTKAAGWKRSSFTPSPRTTASRSCWTRTMPISRSPRTSPT